MNDPAMSVVGFYFYIQIKNKTKNERNRFIEVNPMFMYSMEAWIQGVYIFQKMKM